VTQSSRNNRKVESARQFVVDVVLHTLAHPLLSAAFGAKRVHREYPVTSETDGELYQGVTDLVWFDGPEKGLSERHACRLVGQWRTTQRYQPRQCHDEDRVTQSVLTLASQYGAFAALDLLAGTRGIAGLVLHAG